MSMSKPFLGILASEDLRSWLTSDLAARCRKNPQYSLRSYARFLELDPSTLAKMIKGKREIGQKVASRLVSKLGFPQGFAVDAMLSTKEASYPFSSIAFEDFKSIADWYHYAILELMHTDHFVSDAAYVADALGINVHECREAIARLIRLQMLRVKPDGTWVDNTDGTSTTLEHPYTEAAHRKLQQNILEQAIVALEETPMAERDQSSMTVAIDSSRLPVAKEMIKKFRRELTEYLSSGPKKDRVYQMSFSVFPVSKL